MRNKVFVLLLTILVLGACKQSRNNNDVVNIDSIDLTDKNSVLSELDSIGTGIPIFYNMYLSVELSSLFETAGAVFSKDILNSNDKTSDYITSYKKAMNMGVYAVDLSYSRAFEQFEDAARYFTAMQSLSEQIGIPSTYFKHTANRFEKNLTDKDSLIAIANEVYYSTEDYLKENERFATASVIILAGWVEAIYIGSHVAIESRNPDVIERLVDQKYSLNNLLIMLSEYKDNEVVAEYIAMLEALRETFMEINIEVPIGFNDNSDEATIQLEGWLNDIQILQNEIGEIRTSITQ